MSLSSELDRRGSPVRELVEFVGGIVADAKRGVPWGPACQAALGIDALDSVPKVPSPAGMTSPGIVGAAFDYRLRYALNPSRTEDLIARRFAPRVARLAVDGTVQMDEFFASLDKFSEDSRPWEHDLDTDDELTLARYCAVLAMFETVIRAPSSSFTFAFPDRVPDGPGLLELPSEHVVMDVANLMHSAREVFGPLIEVARLDVVPYYANPVFAGSRDVGGADADFIIDDVSSS